MQKDDTVRYTGGKHSLLENGKDYKVSELVDGGVRVYIPTGFCGIPEADCILVQIAE